MSNLFHKTWIQHIQTQPKIPTPPSSAPVAVELK